MEKDHKGLGRALIEAKAVPTFQDIWHRKYVSYTIVAKDLGIDLETFREYTVKPSIIPDPVILQIAKYFGAKVKPLRQLVKAGIKKEQKEDKDNQLSQ